MTKEEFELLQSRQKESGKSLKAFLAEEGIWFTRYYYWKKKYSQPKMEAGLFPLMRISGPLRDKYACGSIAFQQYSPEGSMEELIIKR